MIDQRLRLAEHGMYRPEFEGDACGVGMVAATDGRPQRPSTAKRLVLGIALMFTLSGAAIAQTAPRTAPADPARLALAQKVVTRLVPQGIYLRLMRDTFPKMMDAMIAQMSGMTAADLGEKDKSGKTLQ